MAETHVTGSVFGVSHKSISRHLRAFCTSLGKRLHDIIALPDVREAQNLATLNQRITNFPQAYGAIDGCHIAVFPPKQYGIDFYNKKGFPSLVLQAVVDCNYRFRNINSNMPGSTHDAAVLAESGLYLQSHKLPKGHMQIHGTNIPLLILGDAAYSSRSWLMRPYVGTNLTAEEMSFNFYHSSSRIVVKNAFGRLKGRWRILMKQVPVALDFAPEIIATCCMLHNICEQDQTPEPGDESGACVNDPPTQPLNECTRHRIMSGQPYLNIFGTIILIIPITDSDLNKLLLYCDLFYS